MLNSKEKMYILHVQLLVYLRAGTIDIAIWWTAF